jgi:trigger factor
LPKFKLPDYKKIAAGVMKEKSEKIEVSEKEISEVLDEIKRQRVVVGQQNTKEGEDTPKKTVDEIKIDDDFAKSLGDFKNLSELKEQIKKNIEEDKKHKEKDKRRLKIVEGILDETKLLPPDILVENEINRMFSELKFNISQAGIDFEEYLRHIKKTEEELRKGWRDAALKKVKVDLLLSEISKEEKVKPEQNKVDEEVDKLKEMHPDVDLEKIKTYVSDMLIYEETYKLLENQK